MKKLLLAGILIGLFVLCAAAYAGDSVIGAGAWQALVVLASLGVGALGYLLRRRRMKI